MSVLQKLPPLLKGPLTTPQSVQTALSSITEYLERWNGVRGDSLDRVLTMRDFVSSTETAELIAQHYSSTGADPVIGGIPAGAGPIYAPSPPENLVAVGSLTNIILSWDIPTNPYYAYSEIWRNGSDDLGTAVLVGTAIAGVFADPIGDTGVTYYYWVRSVNTANVAGGYNDTPGTVATTGQVDEANFASTIDPVSIVDALPNPVGYTGPVVVFLTTDLKLYRYDSVTPAWTTAVTSDDLLANSVIAGKIAAGAISTSNLFVDGVITSTKIAAGTITADRIAAATITAAQIAAGTITGDRIAANTITADKITTTSLSAIAANLGTITSGNITLSATSYIRGGATGFRTGTGFWQGYDGGVYKFSIGNSATGQEMYWDGSTMWIRGSVQLPEYTPGAFTLIQNNTARTVSSNVDVQSPWTKVKEYRVVRYGTVTVNTQIEGNSGTDMEVISRLRILVNGLVVHTFPDYLTTGTQSTFYPTTTIDTEPDDVIELQVQTYPYSTGAYPSPNGNTTVRASSLNIGFGAYEEVLYG